MGAQCASPCVSAAAVVVTARRASLQSSSSATSSLQPSPRRHSSSQEDPAYAFLTVSSLLQFPSLSVKAAEWLLTGVALCGAAMASEGTVAMSAMGGTRGGIDASEEVALAAGWCCVGGVVVALLIWFVQSRRLFFDTEKEHSIATPLFVPSNAHQGRCTFLKANGFWQPVTTVQRCGVLFDPMRGTSLSSSSPSSSRAWWWRWVSVAVPVTVAGVTGAGGVSGSGCTASLSVFAVLLFSAGIAFAVARPYTLLSENVLNPIKYALLGATCVVLLVVREESDQSTPLTVIAAMQTAVVVLRLVAKVLLRCLSRGATPNSHLAQEEGCARREGPSSASRDGVPLRYQPPPSTEPSASSQVPPPSDHVEPHQQAERDVAYSPLDHPHETLAKQQARAATSVLDIFCVPGDCGSEPSRRRYRRPSLKMLRKKVEKGMQKWLL